MFNPQFFINFIGKYVMLRCFVARGDQKESSYYSGVVSSVLTENGVVVLTPIKNAENHKNPIVKQLLEGNIALVPAVMYIPIDTIYVVADLLDRSEEEVNEPDTY